MCSGWVRRECGACPTTLVMTPLFEIPDDEPVVVKAPAGRSKVFRSYDRDQSFLMPPSLEDWLPQNHTARFIAEVV